MQTPLDRTHTLSPEAERLTELASAELGTLDEAAKRRGLRALRQRLDRRGSALRLAPRGLVLVVALVALLGIGIGRYVLSTRSAVLEYVVDGRGPADSGMVDASSRSKLLRFSDGTEVTLMQGGRGRVSSVSEHGAALSLERGQMGLSVTPRTHAEWSLSAGPFLIHVTGTRFTTDWQPESAVLEVKLEHGSVNVTGPLSEDPIRLRAGQELLIRLHEREVRIRELETTAVSPTEASQLQPASPQPSGAALTPSPAAVPTPAPSASSAGRLSWSVRVAAGDFDQILREARASGVEQVLRSASAEDLAALADAARFRRESSLARRALQSQRDRFPSSSRAKDAAFLLGRMAEADGSPAQAVAWYDRYLVEAPRGTYASEALGRKMLAIETVQGKSTAKAIARQYLMQFPSGSYAKAAKSLTQQD